MRSSKLGESAPKYAVEVGGEAGALDRSLLQEATDRQLIRGRTLAWHLVDVNKIVD
jgi:hypothetical protein